MQVLRLVIVFGLVLPWAVRLAAAQGQISPGRWGERFERYVATNDALKEGLKKIDPKAAKKERAHPVRWDFEALEARFKITRLVMRERDVILICEAKVEGIVKESDFRFSRFDRDKKRLATKRTVRLLQGDMRLEEPGARAGTIKAKAGEEFRVVLDWVPYAEDVRYVVVGSDETPREPGPPPEAPTGFERPELILDGSEHGRLYPTFADIDGDGKIDMLVGTWTSRLLVYRNKGTNARPVYAKPTWLDETVPSAKTWGVQG
jgi:hypothetical protein